MADLKKLVSLENLTSYDTLIKKYIGDADAVVNARSIKTVLVDGDNIKFYKKENATVADTADYTVAIASSDVDNLKKILSGYTTEGSVKAAIDANAQAISDEADRADAAEKANKKAIEDEAKRADEAEKANAQAISDEETRAKAAELANTNAIGAEVTRATAAEEANASAIASEKSRAEAAESDLDTAVKAAQKTADDITTLVGTIPSSSEAETVTAYVAEQVAKASGDASKVAADLESYKTTNDAAVLANKTAVETEATTARAAEEALGGRIDDVEDLIGDVEEGKTVMGIVADNLTEAKGYTDAEIGKLGSVLNFKGTVATVAALPTEGMKVGDVYHVTEKSSEYVYTTDGWEELGSVIDLSAYETIEGAEGKIATAKSEAVQAAKDYADGLDEAMDARMDAVEAAIGEGGSVQDKIDASIALLDSSATLGEGEDYLTGVTITDGKITAHTAGVFNFDEKGAAQAVQDDLDNYKYTVATSTEINKLFSDEEEA